MGWMASWVAVKGAPKVAVLEALGLSETGEEVLPGARYRGISCGELPDGWTVVFSEDFDWASRERVLELSRLGQAVGLQFEDKVEMTAIATGAQGGAELWRVYHDNDKRRLEVSGEPPPEFAAIRDQLMQAQEDDGGEESDTDFLHDIPLETAKAACGYRADDWVPAFIGLVGPGAEPEPVREARPGFFARLFGRRG